MIDKLQQQIDKLTQQHENHKRWLALLVVLAGMVVAATAHALVRPAITLENTTYCGQTEHTHTEACYTSIATAETAASDQELTCGKEEHTHTLVCYADPTADIENEEDWANSVAQAELTGNWGDDLAAVAQSQLGYAASEKNYTVTQDGETKQPYTRYGAWSGDAYTDWNLPFVNFCLHYAQIPAESFPVEADLSSLMEALTDDERNQFAPADGYVPQAGDVALLTNNGEDISAAGIVAELCAETDDQPAKVAVIEADESNTVRRVEYALGDEKLLGYGVMPENAEAEQTSEKACTPKDSQTATFETSNQAAEDEIAVQAASNKTIVALSAVPKTDTIPAGTKLTQSMFTITATYSDGTTGVIPEPVTVTSPNWPNNYENYMSESQYNWTNTFLGADVVEVSFHKDSKTERNKDKIFLYDKNGTQKAVLSGTEMAGKRYFIPGDTAKITMSSDSSTEYRGFSAVVSTAMQISPEYAPAEAGTFTVSLTLLDKAAQPTDIFATAEFIDSGNARGTCGENVQWSYSSDGTLTITGSGAINDYAAGETPWSSYTVKNVIIEDGITHIGANAFSLCKTLQSITLPANVNVDEVAFAGCEAIAELNVTTTQPQLMGSRPAVILKDCIGDVRFTIQDGITLQQYAFSECHGLTSIKIEGNLKETPFYGFFYCSKLRSVELPDSLTRIGSGSFSNCDSLETIKIPDNVTTISDYAFSGCDKLDNVVLPEKVSYIGNNAFAYCKSLKNITIPKDISWIMQSTFKGCTSLQYFPFENLNKLTSIDEEAFSGCEKLTEVNLPDTVQYIDSSAFAGTGLTSLTIPRNAERVDSGAVKDCTKLEEVKWNAKNGRWMQDEPLYAIGTKWNLTVGQAVEVLPAETMNAFALCDAKVIRFEGPNWLKISNAGQANGALPLGALPDGNYYADKYGALYRLEEDYAVLAYLPAEMAAYTVPDVVPANKAVTKQLPVTAVGSHALHSAVNLESLTFQKPEQISVLEDFAFAYASKLSSINGASTVQEALDKFSPACNEGRFLFIETKIKGNASESIVDTLHLTGLPDSNENDTLEVTIKTTSSVKYPEPIAADRTQVYYTGEAAVTTLIISNPASAKIESDDGAVVRLYMNFDSEGGMPQLATGEYTIVVNSGTTYTYKVSKLPGTNIYCFEIQRPCNGDTITLNLESGYASPTTGGGTNRIFGMILSKAEKDSLPGGKLPAIDQYQNLQWKTKVDKFPVTKERVNQTVWMPSDGNGHGYIVGLAYRITLTREGDTLEGVGKDLMKSIEYTDVMTLPEGVTISEKALRTIQAGNYYWSQNGSVYDAISEDDRSTLLSIYVQNNSSIKFKRRAMEVNESGQFVFHLTMENSTLQTGSPVEMPSQKIEIRFGSSILYIDEPVAQQSYEFHNKVTAVEHFSYSEDQIYTAECPYTFTSGTGSLSLSKDLKLGSSQMGDKRIYTITASNSSALPYEKLAYLDDEVPYTEYLSADDIVELFKKDQEAKQVSVKISNATICEVPDSTEVRDMNGNVAGKVSVGNTDIGNDPGKYSGMNKGKDPTEKANSAVITISWSKDETAADRLWFTLNNITAAVHYREASCALEAKAIQELLDSWGYLVAYRTTYTVRWDLCNEDGTYVLPGGQKINYELQVTNKDSFMMLDTDQKHMYSTDYVDEYNYAYGRDVSYKSLDTALKSALIYREFSLIKEADVHGQEIDEDGGILTDNTIINYSLTVDHESTAHYDILPLTDHMSGPQTLLAEVERNKDADWTMGLNTFVGDDGINYYKLDAEKTYKGVWLDGRYADSVQVTSNGAGRDTIIKWYFSDYEDYRTDTVNYKALLQLKGLENGYYNFHNETWLGDHETHRLYNEVGWVRLDYTFDKKIVQDENDHGDGENYCPIEEGQTVTYRLKLQTIQAGPYTLTGINLYDALPKCLGGSKGFSWQKGDGLKPGTVDIVKYDCPKTGAVKNPDNWSIETDVNDKTSQYIKWDDNFSITFGHDPVYIYVRLTYPDGSEWQAYAKEYGSQILENTFFVEGIPSKVTHVLSLPMKAYLQKGVYKTFSTYCEPKWSSSMVTGTEPTNRLYYCNDDLMVRYVLYYVVLRNDGQSRLYLNDMQDTLPKGFTLQRMVSGDPTYVYYTERPTDSINTDSNTERPYSFITSKKQDGTWTDLRSVHVDVSMQTDEATDVQKLTFHFTQRTSTYYNTRYIQYDEQLDKCYLNPGEAIVFGYYCRTNNSADTEDTATNTIAMPYYDYSGGGLVLGDGQQTTTKSDVYTANDGTCEIWDYGTAASKGFKTTGDDLVAEGSSTTQWLESDVTVRRGSIAPGITKKLAAKINQNGITTTNPLAAHPVDTLRWELTAQNNGTLPMVDYTLSDTMPAPYYFTTGDITYTVAYMCDGQRKIWGKSTTDGYDRVLLKIKETDDDETFEVRSYKEKATLKVNEDPVRIKVPWYVTDSDVANWSYEAFIEIAMTCDSTTKATTLWIHFMDPCMSIPEGGMATLTLDTRAPDDTTWRNTVYTNSCNITPMVQPWDTSAVNQGNATTQTPVFDDKERASVRNSAPVTVTYGYATTSLKTVEEVANPDNKANSNSDRSYIVLPGKDSTFRYTLAVTNEDPTGSGQKSSMDELIFIDSLPQQGDHTVFQTDDPRYSDFAVSLADKYDPVVTIKAKDGTTKTLEQSKYKLEFSDQTEFTTADWDGTSTWDTLPAQARSVRLILKDPNAATGTDPLMPSGSTISLSFVCKVDDPNAAAGQIAWNSFGYHYIMHGTNMAQEAAPLKVGVMLPTQPTLQKKLQLNGAPYTAEKNETFTFYCYTGRPLADLRENWTAAQLEAKLTEAHRDWRIISVAVTAGDTASAVQQLTDTEKWTWQKNQVYTIVEVPNDRYTLTELNGIQQNTYTFTYDPARSVAITAVNTRDSWSFTLEKVDEDAPDTHLADAWFALYSKDDRDIMTGEAYAALTCKAESTITDGDTTWYLTQVGVTRADTGYLTFTGLTRDEYRLKEIKAPNGYAPDETLHTITREDNAKKICKITNKRAYRLPNTGGCGTTPFTVAGLLLIAAASCLLFKKYRRKQEGGTASSRF